MLNKVLKFTITLAVSVFNTIPLPFTSYKHLKAIKLNAPCTLDRGQTGEICEKQEKYSKGKVVTFTVQSLILYQYSVDVLTFFELY